MSGKSSGFVFALMLLGALLGALGGYFWPEMLLSLEFIGSLFVHALTLIALPLTVSILVLSAASLGDFRKLGRTFYQVIGYFLATTAVAAVIGIVVTLVLSPGSGGAMPATLRTGHSFPPDSLPFIDYLSQIIPGSIGEAFSGGYFGAMLLSLFVGAGIGCLGGRARSVQVFFKEVHDAILKVFSVLLWAAPVAFFCLVGGAVASQSDSLTHVTGELGWFVLVVVIGLVVHGGVILPLILRFFSGRSFFEYFSDLSPALMTGFATASSTATLPAVYEGAVERGSIDRKAGSIVVSLGSVMNLNGTALFLAAGVVFLGQLFGVEMSMMQIVSVGLLAVIMPIGTAGVAPAAPAMMTVMMAALGFPPSAYAGLGLILVVDFLLSRLRTTVDVWGDAVGAAVVADSFSLVTGSAAGQRTERRAQRARDRKERTRPDRSERPERPDSRGGQSDRFKSADRGESRQRPPREQRTGRGRSDRGSSRTDAPSPFKMSGGREVPVVEDLPESARATMEAGVELPPPDRRGRPSDTRRTQDRPDREQRDKSQESPRDAQRDSQRDQQRDSQRDTQREQRLAKDRSDDDRGARRRDERSGRRDDRRGGRRDDRKDDRRDDRKNRDQEAKPVVADEPVVAEPVVTETPVAAAEEAVKAMQSPGRLNPAVLARELAKVQAQLHSDTDEVIDDESTPDSEDEASEAVFDFSHDRSTDSRGADDADAPEPDLFAGNEEGDREVEDRNRSGRGQVAPTDLSEVSDVSDEVEEETYRRAGEDVDDIIDDEAEEESYDGAGFGSVDDESADDAEPTSVAEPSVTFGRSRARRGDKLRREMQGAKEGASDEPQVKEEVVEETYSTDDVSFGRGKRKRTK